MTTATMPPALFDLDEFEQEALEAATVHWSAVNRRPAFNSSPTLAQFLKGPIRSTDEPWWWQRWNWRHQQGYDTVWDQPGHTAIHAYADTRCDNDHNRLANQRQHSQGRCSCVGHLLHLIACTCGYSTGAHPSENDAAEAFSDIHTPGWRDLPAIPVAINPGWELTKAEERRKQAWIETNYGDRQPGSPIRSDRYIGGGRHVPRRSPWDGFDLAAALIERPATRHSHGDRIWRDGPTCKECA